MKGSVIIPSSNNISRKVIFILMITAFAILIDFVPAFFGITSPIWMGEAIEAAGAVIFGPLIGGIAAFIKNLIMDLMIYESFEYIGADAAGALAVVLIAVIYRKKCSDISRFGVREIVLFNFIQVIVNVMVYYFMVPPIMILFFDNVISTWDAIDISHEMSYQMSATITACASVALIGSPILGGVTILAERWRKSDKKGLRSLFLKNNYIKNAYRNRAILYTISIFMGIILNLIDTILSGHLFGEEALGAISVTYPMISFCSFMSALCIDGCVTLSSLAHGRKDYKCANELFTSGLISTVVIGVLQTLICIGMKDLYFSFFDLDDSIRALAEEYYSGFIFVPLILGLTTFLAEIVVSEGDDFLADTGYVIHFVLNVVFSYILGRSIGMKGLAYGTLVGYVAYAALLSLHFFKKNNTFSFSLRFSFKDIASFVKLSLATAFPFLCMSLTSLIFTKSIIIVLGNEYLVVNTILCSLLEIYEMINGPAEAAYYMMSTYSGEKNGRSLKQLFSYAMWTNWIVNFFISLMLLSFPDIVLYLFDVEETPLYEELITCIRYCAIGINAASFTGFLNHYYTSTGKPFWAIFITTLKTLLLPTVFCVTFGIGDGIIGMGIGMLIAQVITIAIFFGFLIMENRESIPYLTNEIEYKSVYSETFDLEEADIKRIAAWIRFILETNNISSDKIFDAEKSFAKISSEIIANNSDKKKVFGECVITLGKQLTVSVKDNGKLFKPGISDKNFDYHVLLSNNCNIIYL